MAARTRSPRYSGWPAAGGPSKYLLDITNWIAYDEAVALWQAGARVTHHPGFARAVGEDAARRLAASQVAAMLRSLGSPERVYGAIATSSAEFSTVTKLEVSKAASGFAEIVASAADGFPRSTEHCAWTCGLLSCTPVLFGLDPAIVHHEECQAMGATRCVYRVRWDTEADAVDGSPAQIIALQHQLDAMTERLRSVFAAASDLIAADDLDDVLARITARAALEVRAVRYLLAVQVGPGRELHCHQKGFEEEGVAEYVDELLHRRPTTHPDSWLVVPVRSNRREYGRLLALRPPGQKFLAQERELFEVYAHYAATALDGASALMEAKRRSEQSSALLSLARALAAAGTSSEIARRLASAVPLVVDCDRVGVYLWDAGRGELVRRAVTTREAPDGVEVEDTGWAPTPGGPLHRLLEDPGHEPLFVDDRTGDPRLREILGAEGFVATILVPLATPDSFLGLLSVSVFEEPGAATAGLRPARPPVRRRRAGHDRAPERPPRRRDDTSGDARPADRARQPAPVHRSAPGRDQPCARADPPRHSALHGSRRFQARQRRVRARRGRPAARGRGQASGVVHACGGHRRPPWRRRVRRPDRFEPAPTDAEDVSDRLAAAVTQPFVIDGHQLHLGISIGRAVFPIDADDADGLLRCADAAMFSVKRNARAGVAYLRRAR